MAAYSQVHCRNLPTRSHGSSDKYRLTSQLKKKKHKRLTTHFIFHTPVRKLWVEKWPHNISSTVVVFLGSVDHLPFSLPELGVV